MKNILFFILILMTTAVQAAPPTRSYTYVPNTTIDPNQNNTNENSLYSYLQTGVDTYADGSITGADISPVASIPYSTLSLGGSIINADISASAAISPSKIAGGYGVLPSGAIYFMLTGACPTGTTDVSATYANKFIKINATQGTSSGVVLTGTTDGHQLTASEIPPLPIRTNVGGASFGSTAVASSNAADDNTFSGKVNNGVTAAAHTHTLSTASTLEPSSITMKACQVN